MADSKNKFNRFYIDVLNSLKVYSTCSRLQVAAILVKDSRILSSGYNGVAKGCVECKKIFFRDIDGKYVYSPSLITGYRTVASEGKFFLDEEEYRKIHHEFADKYEIHAEMNCLGFALKNNTDITGAQLFLTTSPCLNCCKLILTSGIKEVYYIEEYDDRSGIEYLLRNGVTCEKIEL
jgi:dCMP deaminase